jgi:magnesium-dependent phosphatase-1
VTGAHYIFELFSPFDVVGDGTKELRDRRGDSVKLIGESGRILHDLKHNEYWSGVRVAWVSRCDEPSWADECLKKFRSCPEQLDPLHILAHSSHIYKANKKEHFRRLQQEFPEIDFKDMIFYDNEYSNITSVGSLGVHSVYCPDGMTKRVWEESLAEFASK